MATPGATLAIDYASLEDTALAGLAQGGHREAFRHIMQRCNQRLFRVARGVLNDDAEAEDVVQEAYAHAFEKLATFRGEASLLTWLTRIVLNEAHGRLRQRRPTVDIDQIEISQTDGGQIVQFPSKFGNEDPDPSLSQKKGPGCWIATRVLNDERFSGVCWWYGLPASESAGPSL